MRIPRIHHPEPLTGGSRVTLDEVASGHVARVLRLKPGAELVLFDGRGGEFAATLVEAGRKRVVAEVGAFRDIDCESSLRLTLAQGISRGERMDLTIQKAVELGVARIVPVITERTVVKLNAERWDKRVRHWQGVAVAACEQSGRNRVPELAEPVRLDAWLAQPVAAGFLLDPRAEHGLAERAPADEVTLLIGPEGGLAEPERAAAYAAGYRGLRLGPRILRTETAALAALAVLQSRWGDLDPAAAGACPSPTAG